MISLFSQLYMQKINNLLFIYISTLIVCYLYTTNVSFAGTNGAELKSAYDTLTGYLTGYAGKIISIVSWALGIVGSIAKFNTTAILTSFGVAITTTVAPLFVDATITATLNF